MLVNPEPGFYFSPLGLQYENETISFELFVSKATKNCPTKEKDIDLRGRRAGVESAWEVRRGGRVRHVQPLTDTRVPQLMDRPSAGLQLRTIDSERTV